MWYLFGILYFAMGLTIGVVELRSRQKYDTVDSNRYWYCVPLYLFFWLPLLLFYVVVILIEKIKKL